MDLSRHRDRLAAMLSLLELTKAARFRSPNVRLRYVVSHAVLRFPLSIYSNTEPNAIQMETGMYGKPRTASPARARDVVFNLSHSEGLVLYAFGLHDELGIDVEKVRPIGGDEMRIAQFFSEGEKQLLERSRVEDRIDVFFTLWTLKEAYLKAVGKGLSRQLHQFEISLVPGRVPNLEIPARGNSVSSCWHLLSFVPEEGFRAALAVEGNSPDIEFLVPTSDLFNV